MSKRNVVELHTKDKNKFFRGSQIQSYYSCEEYDLYSDFSTESKYDMVKKILNKNYQKQQHQEKGYSCKTNLNWRQTVLPYVDPKDLEEKLEYGRSKHVSRISVNEEYDAFSKRKQKSYDVKEEAVCSKEATQASFLSHFSTHEDNDEFDALFYNTKTYSPVTTGTQYFNKHNKTISNKNGILAHFPLQTNNAQIKVHKLSDAARKPQFITSITNADKQLTRARIKSSNDRDALPSTTKCSIQSHPINIIHVAHPTSSAAKVTAKKKEEAHILYRQSSNLSTQGEEEALEIIHFEPETKKHFGVEKTRQFTFAGEPHHLKPYKIGLPNPIGSNRCWLNATLQVLIGMVPFINDLCDQEYKITEPSILLAFIQVVKARECCNKPGINSALQILYKMLEELDAMFTSGDQLDAAEFLTKLLENFHISFENSVCSSSNGISNAVQNNFDFVLESLSSCTRCSKTRSYEEVNRMLLLSAANINIRLNLQDLVESYFTTEKRSCTSGCEVQCNVQIVFRQLPRFLIIQLKRYVMKDGLAQKICHAVGIPVRLFMKRFLRNASLQNVHHNNPPKTSSAGAIPIVKAAASNTKAANTEDSQNIQLQVCPDGDEYNYRLIGTIIHHGSSLNSGHYVADVYNLKHRAWYHYDDTLVSQITEEEALGMRRQRNGYVLVYISSLVARNYMKK